MSSNTEALAAFIREHTGCTKPISRDEDLFENFGIDGDDAVDFIEEFSTRFNVDVSKFLWYFHHGGEGQNLGGLFFKPPNERVERLPITPRILEEAIETGRWPIVYPDHSLPKVRWDIRINLAIFLPIPVLIITYWILTLSGRGRQTAPAVISNPERDNRGAYVGHRHRAIGRPIGLPSNAMHHAATSPHRHSPRPARPSPPRARYRRL